MLLVAATSVALGIANPSAATAWPTYVNVRYGYQICYPARLLKPQPEADNGDGRKFSGVGGAQLLVFGQFNVSDSSLGQWAADAARTYTGKRGRITYRAARPNWVVLSGTDGGHFAFYTKTLKRDDEFVTFQLKYSHDQARLYRPIVERLSRCMVLTRLPS